MYIIKKRMPLTRKMIAAGFLIGSLTMMASKDKHGVIMTVDGEDVPTEEFLYLYEKNNAQQTHPQTLDEYLDLFQIYRLKVAEAKEEGIDTTSNFKKEVAQYRRELLEPYITDTVFFNQLVDIAVEREKTGVESSHIMIIRTHNPEKDSRNLELLDSLRTELLSGADFIELAKKYSQDKFSSDKGGYLGFTPAGTFPYGFETAEYETPEGEISEIIESHVGWHIVKSGARKSAEELNYPKRSREEIKAEVERKSSSPFDTRYHMIRKQKIDRLRNKHKNLTSSLEGKNDDEIYEILILEEENDQYATNMEYKNLVDEYTNGSLLYEVSVKNVWDKAANDEEGLENYYAAHKDNYKWNSPHAKGILIQALNDSIGNAIQTRIAGLPSDSVVSVVRNEFKRQASADKFNVAQGVNAMIDNLMFGGEAVSPSVKNFKVYFVVDSHLAEQPEELNDVRGLVVSDYQENLEKDWVEKLKQKHQVDINHKELKRVKKNIK